METKANYALIGGFVLTAGIAIMGFVLWLGASQFNRDFVDYDIVFTGPISLEEGAAVRYIGIKVGEVESVRIDRRDASKVRTRISVDRSTPVKTDSTASIEFAGITGVTFVQINAGSEMAGPLLLKPGQDVPEITALPNPFAELFASGAEIAGRASQTIEQAGALLSDENIAAFGRILQNTDGLLSALDTEDEAILQQVSATLAALQEAGEDLSRAADATTEVGLQTQAELAGISAELRLLLTDLRGATGSAQAGFEEGKRALETARALVEGPANEALAQTGQAALELRTLITRLDRVVREIERNPQSLVVGRQQPYEEAR